MNFKIVLLVIALIFFYQKLIKNEETVEPIVSKQLRSIESLNIDFYTTSWCKYCTAARKYMNTSNIPYKEYDIEKNALGKIKYERIMKEIGREGERSIPMFDLDGKIFHGFSKKKLNREINLARSVEL